jgi:hypothetical protein
MANSIAGGILANPICLRSTDLLPWLVSGHGFSETEPCHWRSQIHPALAAAVSVCSAQSAWRPISSRRLLSYQILPMDTQTRKASARFAFQAEAERYSCLYSAAEAGEAKGFNGTAPLRSSRAPIQVKSRDIDGCWMAKERGPQLPRYG